MNTDTPHRGDLDPVAAALAALGAAHRSLSAVIDRELRAAGGLSPAITSAGRDVLDKATPVLAAIAREHIAIRLPAADLRKLTQALRTIASTSRPRPASAGDRKHEPARAADPACARSARDRAAPAPPAHPQHRSPARRRITTAGPAPQQPMTAASPAAAHEDLRARARLAAHQARQDVRKEAAACYPAESQPADREAWYRGELRRRGIPA